MSRREWSPRTALPGCWIIGKVNGSFRQGTVKGMMQWFGLTGSSSQRAETLLRAAGYDPDTLRFHHTLLDPAYLTSRQRENLIGRRDRLQAALDL